MVEYATSKDPHSDKRRSTRIIQAVPLSVTGVDALGRPFQERTSAVVINCHGCRYQSKHYVLKNMWVTLQIPHPETGREPRSVRARVMWIQRPRTVRELFQVGVELEVPGNVWGIAFPPADWFAFPEGITAEVALPEAETQAPAEEWVLPGAANHEDNIRVLPSPGGNEASLALARQVARMVVEAKQQVQNVAREAIVQAVASEARPLLAAIQNQLKEASEKSVQTAVASEIDQVIRQATAKIDEARQASAEALHQEWGREAERRVQEASQQLAAQLANVGQTQREAYRQDLVAVTKQVVEQLNKVSSEIASTLENRAREVKPQLEKLEQTARSLSDEMVAATTTAQAGWRGRLDTDLAAAFNRWNEKIETSLESATRQAAERLARNSQAATSKLEQDLTLRVAALRQSFEQATAEAESTLGTLREVLNKETARAKASLAQIQQAAAQVGEHASRVQAMTQTAAEELERRCEAILAAQSAELDRRAQSALESMAERMRPMIEAAGQQTLTHLAAQLEQQLSPHLDRAHGLVEKLAAEQQAAEETLRAHQERLRQVSEQSVQQAVSRLEGAVGRLEKDIEEAGRAATAKWLAELDAKATDTTHTTFEALYKSSEWYEKKSQTHMQAVLDKGLEQASNALREKAGEISGLFASELDHYSRSYVEHTQGQMEEISREAVDRARDQMAQAGETAAATFGGQTHGIVQREYDRFTGAVQGAFDQTTARLETHLAHVRSKLDAHARQFFAEFQKGMSQQIQQGVGQARQELEAELAPVADAWRVEREAQERQLQQVLTHLGNESVESYKKRLENVSNSWLVTTVTKLNQQSQDLIASLASSAEQRLRETCSQVFARVGMTLHQRLRDFSTELPGTPPEEKK